MSYQASEGWVLGADCPGCNAFAPAFPSQSKHWEWQMYCRCGAIFFTRQTYCKSTAEMTPKDWSQFHATSSAIRASQPQP